jgi:hypothetical protein
MQAKFEGYRILSRLLKKIMIRFNRNGSKGNRKARKGIL